MRQHKGLPTRRGCDVLQRARRPGCKPQLMSQSWMQPGAGRGVTHHKQCKQKHKIRVTEDLRLSSSRVPLVGEQKPTNTVMPGVAPRRRTGYTLARSIQ